MKQKTKKSAIVPEFQPDQQEEEFHLPPSIDSFLKAAQRESASIRVILYRRLKPSGAGRPKRCFLDEYDNEAPTLKEVAAEYGGGEYELQAFSEAEEGESPAYFKTIQFNIDNKYTQDKEKQTAQPMPQQYDPAAQFQQSMGMITTLVQAIAPLLQANQAHAAASSPADMLKGMAELTNNMISSNFKNSMENQKILMETLRENLPATMAGEDVEKEDKSFERIMQALQMFIPVFLKSPAPLQKTMISAAQQNTDVKAILASKVRKAAIKKKLSENFKPEEVEKISAIFEGNHGGNGKVKKQPQPAAAAPAA